MSKTEKWIITNVFGQRINRGINPAYVAEVEKERDELRFALERARDEIKRQADARYDSGEFHRASGLSDALHVMDNELISLLGGHKV